MWLCLRIGLLLGGVDFSNLFIPLTTGTAPATLAEAKAAGIPVLVLMVCS